MSRFPPRIHVLLASQAPVGLVIRRGPSKSVATLRWDRDRDTFHLGQWLKGRIYERRSDISPDGKYAIYFAMNGQWQAEARGSWTAISQVPYLKAIALFPKGDCWNGGGLWTGKASYWLNDGYGHEVLHNSSALQRDTQYRPEGGQGGECLSVYYPRLLRDGWTWVDRIKIRKWQDKDIFEKPIGHGWTLRKIAHAEVGAPVGKGCYWDEHELVGPSSAAPIACPTWEWAELDGKRLVWATKGKLWAAQIKPHGLVSESVLFDFNDMEFKTLEAPY
ncbi:hypothetical protein C7293_30625 [filamentous cyanobacterium CCT1]|nr:hypothetical protein C7293_30625 [filamentous cyanobacterium CCT1]PSN75927.1 hypothetical protein C8B47_29995 [filamentous cyanobacterium CCP4]